MTSPQSVPQLLPRLLPILRAFLSRRAPMTEVDDLVQDVLIRVHKRSAAAPIDNPEGYLFQVAQSALVDRARRNDVRHTSQHVEFAEDHHPTDEISPLRVLEGKEQAERLMQLLAELPPRTRAALLLVRYEGLSYKEVARRFGISVSAVEKHVMKAMVHLTARMQEPI